MVVEFNGVNIVNFKLISKFFFLEYSLNPPINGENNGAFAEYEKAKAFIVTAFIVSKIRKDISKFIFHYISLNHKFIENSK